MYIIDDKTGDMTIRQGDSAEITVTGIPDDREYKLYFSIYNMDRKIVFELMEIPVDGSVTFKIKPVDSNRLIVPKGAKTGNYFYAVKRCYEPDNFEDTLIIGDKKIPDLNKVTVYPLIVEGAENG